jgi:hypothetical protein
MTRKIHFIVINEADNPRVQAFIDALVTSKTKKLLQCTKIS